jgi:hypothetical protein
MYFIVTTTQGLRFDRSRLVELWQIKDKRGLQSRVRQSIVLVVIRSGQKRSKKNQKDILKQKVPERVSEKYNRDFLKIIERFSQKDSSIQKSFWGGPKLDVLIFSSFCHLFGQKIEKTGLTCLKSYQGGMMRLPALCVW